jgi:hypothetical protein
MHSVCTCLYNHTCMHTEARIGEASPTIPWRIRHAYRRSRGHSHGMCVHTCLQGWNCVAYMQMCMCSLIKMEAIPAVEDLCICTCMCVYLWMCVCVCRLSIYQDERPWPCRYRPSYVHTYKHTYIRTYRLITYMSNYIHEVNACMVEASLASFDMCLCLFIRKNSFM